MEMVIFWVEDGSCVMIFSQEWLLRHVCFWLDPVEKQSQVIAARSLPVFVHVSVVGTQNDCVVGSKPNARTT